MGQIERLGVFDFNKEEEEKYNKEEYNNYINYEEDYEEYNYNY